MEYYVQEYSVCSEKLGTFFYKRIFFNKLLSHVVSASQEG